MQKNISTEGQAIRYLDLILEYWDGERCRRCECLQGILVQLKLDWPELKGEVDRYISHSVHNCLGCEPCLPANLWISYLKERGGKR